jgi:ferric-dicitrate binding protein FerR (iron transport regulator)
MDSRKEYIAAAVIRLLSGKATEKERADIREWIAQYPEPGRYDKEGQEDRFLADAYRKFVEGEARVKGEAWELIGQRLVEKGLMPEGELSSNGVDRSGMDRGGLLRARVVRMGRKKYLRVAVAACFLLMAGAAWYIGSSGKLKSKAVETMGGLAAIQPASQGAILTLSDGSKVSLDSAGGGLLRQQGQVSVVKSGNGELKYLNTGSLPAGKLAYNKLTTPKGRQFKLELPDGSKVWLNAGSSLEYPVAFAGAKREVKLDGEAYFEIAHDKQHPFFVNIPDGRGEDLKIQVLGTSFNAMAYGDEAKIQTTLLEGAIRLSRGKRAANIQPGEGATISRESDEEFSVRKVDVERVMSWKNGMFSYSQASLAEIMRDMARWYDVDVRYEGVVPDLKFDGYISRDNSLDKILKILELNHVVFRMEGRTIIVTNNLLP